MLTLLAPSLLLACSSQPGPVGVQAPPAPASADVQPAAPPKDIQAQLAQLPTDPAASPEFHDLPRGAVRLGMSRTEFREKVMPFLPPPSVDSPGDIDQFAEPTPAGGCNLLEFTWGRTLEDVAVFIVAEPCPQPEPVEVLDQ